MRKLTLVLGGVRSGKSSYAASLAEKSKLSVTYIASGRKSDPEMRRRIEEHKKRRLKTWNIIEANGQMVEALKEAGESSGIVIIDCLTMIIGDLTEKKKVGGVFLDKETENCLLQGIDDVLKAIGGLKSSVIVVSNEVGMGIVPPYPSGRLFRDLAGYANKKLASEADEVIFMVSGIPMKIK